MPWDDTGANIGYRLHDPADFKPTTFRTIALKKDKPRVLGIVAKPKAGGGMTLTALRFPKTDGWTLETAKEWYDAHKDNLKSEVTTMETKNTKEFMFEVKEVTDQGVFTGILSVYDVVDLGGDLVEPGAFTKTLNESGGVIPCLWQHQDPVGLIEVHDTGSALEVKGQLVMDLNQDGSPRVPEAYKALALMKAKVVKGMSIGYRTVKSKLEKGVRHLKELALMEGSIVTFPMLPLAQVTSVKSEGEKGDFAEEFDRAQTWAARTMMIQALWSALDSIMWDGEVADADKASASDESIQQFRTAYTAFLPKLISMRQNGNAEADEQKAGRTISAATLSELQGIHDRMREAMDKIQALMGNEAAGTSPEEGKAAGTSDPGAATQQNLEPDQFHSSLDQFRSDLLADLKGAF